MQIAAERDMLPTMADDGRTIAARRSMQMLREDLWTRASWHAHQARDSQPRIRLQRSAARTTATVGQGAIARGTARGRARAQHIVPAHRASIPMVLKDACRSWLLRQRNSVLARLVLSA
ncbi:hypothetical protein ACP93_17860 [Xanthomonas sp. NCPPB 1128]|uniref:hypothetical protein n=1 Tax=Xanthomonas sp. NCPPB 1128 TaxID=1775876 RepID=UPI00065AAF84|nr:hypothetical protein [Xanthomonas sp. NCPPB 1128]KMM74164.1 hypothetical protein ACP93_17860 [Xanthomonas sp. NCPPB 1128]